MKNLLLYFQIGVAVLLTISILFQQRGTAIGSAFGGGQEGGSYSTRRGFQKKLLWASIVLATLFIGLGILNLLVK